LQIPNSQYILSVSYILFSFTTERLSQWRNHFFYEVRYLPETDDIYIIELVSKANSRKPINYEQDSTDWTNLLSRQKSFRFDGKNGSFSAIREERKDKDGTVRGKKAYWSAYRKAHNQQAKKYIGQDLSIASLEKAAVALESTLKEKLGIDASEKIHNTKRLQAESKEHQRIAYLLHQNERLAIKVKQLEEENASLKIQIKKSEQSNFSSQSTQKLLNKKATKSSPQAD
jgi:hypothetical protein